MKKYADFYSAAAAARPRFQYAEEPVSEDIFCCDQVVEVPIDYGNRDHKRTTDVLKIFVHEACHTGPDYPTSTEDLEPDDINIWTKFMFTIGVKHLHNPPSAVRFYGMTGNGVISPLIVTDDEKPEILTKGMIADQKMIGDTSDYLHRLSFGHDLKCLTHGTSYATYCINWIHGLDNTFVDLAISGELYNY